MTIPYFDAARYGIGSARFISVATTADTVGEISAYANKIAETNMVSFVMPKMVSTIKDGALDIPAGAASPGSEIGARLWGLAYFTSAALYNLPIGAIFIPCYICGDLFDAWTLDAEHVEPSRQGMPKRGIKGNVLLACHCCNKRKRQGQITGSVKALADAAGRMVDYPRGKGTHARPGSLYDMHYARTRRDGHTCSTRWEG